MDSNSFACVIRISFRGPSKGKIYFFVIWRWWNGPICETCEYILDYQLPFHQQFTECSLIFNFIPSIKPRPPPPRLSTNVYWIANSIYSTNCSLIRDPFYFCMYIAFDFHPSHNSMPRVFRNLMRCSTEWTIERKIRELCAKHQRVRKASIANCSASLHR